MTDPEDRNLIREELPLSTRVHELAKELGLKSAELLERALRAPLSGSWKQELRERRSS